MNTIRTRAAVAVAALLCTGTISATGARADAPSDGCPRGFAAHTIEEWAALGYPHAPTQVDSPSNGGNGDSVVCGRELGKGTAKQNPSGNVLYEFMDNQLPAG